MSTWQKSKSRLAIAFAACFYCFPAQVNASYADYGYVSAVYSTATGALLFNTSGARSTPPACQGPGLTARFALDGSTVAGKAQIAAFLIAQAQHKRIYITGKSSCSIWGDTETVDWFAIED